MKFAKNGIKNVRPADKRIITPTTDTIIVINWYQKTSCTILNETCNMNAVEMFDTKVILIKILGTNRFLL